MLGVGSFALAARVSLLHLAGCCRVSDVLPVGVCLLLSLRVEDVEKNHE